MTHHMQWNPYQTQQIPIQSQQIPIQSPYQFSPWQSGPMHQISPFGVTGMTGAQGSYSGVVHPHVDLFETSSDVVVACELPSANPNDINLLVNDDSVTISASAFWATGSPSSFYRTVSLPTNVRSEQAVASYNNGLLEIRMPKSESRRRLRVNVNR